MINFSKECDPRAIYGDVLVQLSEKNKNLVVVDADLMKASGSESFKKKYPDRHLNVGIAEQNLLGFSAGLAAMGKIPFASSFACFISQKACDQAVNSVSYNRFAVKMIGSQAGLTGEKNGGTHISVEDLAIFRSMPHVVVADPGDAREFALLLAFALAYDAPVYIRQNKGVRPILFDDTHTVNLGKSVLMCDGEDIGLITTGIATAEGVKACNVLRAEGISVRHIHMPFIKPIDKEEIIHTANKTKKIITVENHSVNGGLGSAVAEVLCENCPTSLIRLGLQDCFGETADLQYLMHKFEIDDDAIINNARKMLVRHDAK